MELSGKFVKLLDLQQGQGKNGAWSRQDFIIETLEQYPKNICLSNWNNKIDLSKVQKGAVIKVSVNIESREFNNKWYTEIRAWKIETETAEKNITSQNSINKEVPWAEAPPEKDDMLPF